MVFYAIGYVGQESAIPNFVGSSDEPVFLEASSSVDIRFAFQADPFGPDVFIIGPEGAVTNTIDLGSVSWTTAGPQIDAWVRSFFTP